MTHLSLRHSLIIVLGLGISQIIGYGTLYYSFSQLAPMYARSFGWTSDGVFALFSVTLFAGGIVSPLIGRGMDRLGPARVMTIGSLLVALALVICASAPDPTSFAVALTAAQVASSMVLYSAAFAALVALDPAAGQRNITWLTLMAGFSSTLFWPLTDWLTAHLEWREILLVFAAMNALICLPIHALIHGTAAKLTRHRAAAVAAGGLDGFGMAEIGGVLSEPARRRAFLLITCAFSLTSILLSAVLVLMVPLLGALGLGSIAVTVGMCFGPAQVFSRFINMLFRGNLTPLSLGLLSTGFLVIGPLVLMLSGGHVAGAVAFAVLAGFGSGTNSIVQGALPLWLFGSKGYGTLTGKLSAYRLATSAAAPFVFAMLIERFGPYAALGVAAVTGLAGIASLAALRPLLRIPASPVGPEI